MDPTHPWYPAYLPTVSVWKLSSWNCPFNNRDKNMISKNWGEKISLFVKCSMVPFLPACLLHLPPPPPPHDQTGLPGAFSCNTIEHECTCMHLHSAYYTLVRSIVTFYHYFPIVKLRRSLISSTWQPWRSSGVAGYSTHCSKYLVRNKVHYNKFNNPNNYLNQSFRF